MVAPTEVEAALGGLTSSERINEVAQLRRGFGANRKLVTQAFDVFAAFAGFELLFAPRHI
jgi:SpoU rRNA methylase family enzyme